MRLLQNISHVHAARRAAAIQPFVVMDVLARAQQLEAAGRRVIHMEIGEPDFGANLTKRYVRFTCTRSMADAEEAAERLGRFCERKIRPTRRGGAA